MEIIRKLLNNFSLLVCTPSYLAYGIRISYYYYSFEIFFIFGVLRIKNKKNAKNFIKVHEIYAYLGQ